MALIKEEIAKEKQRQTTQYQYQIGMVRITLEKGTKTVVL